MATSEHFLERWECLAHPSTTANERAGNYTVLTRYLLVFWLTMTFTHSVVCPLKVYLYNSFLVSSHLKSSDVDPSFTRELCNHQQSLLKRILVSFLTLSLSLSLSLSLFLSLSLLCALPVSASLGKLLIKTANYKSFSCFIS